MEGPYDPLCELEDLSHPEGRLPTRELKSDRTARLFRGRGQDHHPVEPNVDPKRQEALYFAKQISERLEDARARGAFEELVLIAAPAFLGILRGHLSEATLLKHVAKTIDKNLVQLSTAEIREYLIA